MAIITGLAGAVPALDFEADYRRWACARLAPSGRAGLYARMAERSGIEHRWSVLEAEDARLDQGQGFYGGDTPPSTSARMRIYAREAPELALQAIRKLGPLPPVTHLVVASCTGFVAPGIDQIIARRLGLDGAVERVLIGFMGCYAAVTALRTARHIVRSDPGARVLVVTVELSTLHHQDEPEIEPMLAGAQFGDGAAAALVEGCGRGLEIGAGLSATLDGSDDLITWEIADTGFRMHLSGAVPARIAAALGEGGLGARIAALVGTDQPVSYAVHAGGRSILDAVERGLHLPPGALAASRAVLRECGNISSSTLMFVLERLMQDKPTRGIALAFGPGLAVEGFVFGWHDA
ncbi:type III polyketide synthase [Erythrobacteraceae bacterium CFH 75059]|nr:type III polyketide synthase [Qipengyuania thermophila]TCD05554.1 type III polyketide synthase [Erythrobacteraceae bacterium CFH 75059]